MYIYMCVCVCVCDLQGREETKEEAAQRTSSTVLAKEALIEIDYSNLSEDHKVSPGFPPSWNFTIPSTLLLA